MENGNKNKLKINNVFYKKRKQKIKQQKSKIKIRKAMRVYTFKTSTKMLNISDV